ALGAEVAEKRTSAWDRGEAVRKVLLEPGRPVVTLALIALNLLVFIAGAALAAYRKAPLDKYFFGKEDAQVSEVLHDLGAISYVDLLVEAQWWRLLSHAFVHIGLLHLLLNMYFLYSLGPLVET